MWVAERIVGWNAELTFNNDDSIYVKKGGIEFTLSNPTNIDGENIDLAGYSISDIDMYFMYKNSGEGISLEPVDAIFYKAIYRMKVVNAKDVYQRSREKNDEHIRNTEKE